MDRALLRSVRSSPTGNLAPHHILIRQRDRRNRGYGRRRAFEVSSGNYIVPFDTSIVYGRTYADLLERYFHLATERMLLEICALRRNTVENVGGWRTWSGARMSTCTLPSERYGLLAYPTGEPHSQSRVLNYSFERQMRYATARGSVASTGRS